MLIALALLVAGCALRVAPPAMAALLEQADEQMIEGKYSVALRFYEDFLAAFPDDPAAPRAQATQAPLERLRDAESSAQLLERDVTQREAELARLRAELVTARLDAARLRADLERLKLIDLRLERRQGTRGQ